jgi:hypothetical protein
VHRIGLEQDRLLCVPARLPALFFSCHAPHVLIELEYVCVYLIRTFFYILSAPTYFVALYRYDRRLEVRSRIGVFDGRCSSYHSAIRIGTAELFFCTSQPLISMYSIVLSSRNA